MKSVSIIVPVYNTEKYIEKCIKSLLNQNYYNYEIVIINDGSTDNSENVILKYKTENPNIIKYYKKENTGVADTRNFGIEKAQGEYVIFVDSDDCVEKSLLSDLSGYFEENIDLIKYKIERVDEKGAKIESIEGPCFEKKRGEDGFNILYSTDKVIDTPCAYAIKRKIFLEKNLRFKKDTYHEDFGLMPLLIVSCNTMVSINKYLYLYVQRDESITRNTDKQKNIKKAYDLLKHYDNMIEKIKGMKLKKKTKENLKIYYTNCILLRIEELDGIEQKKYIKEIKKRKMIKNIKVRNIKQLVKKILLKINIKLYLKVR